MKFLLILSRLIVGVTFTISGLLKGIDPLGFTYKISDYFTAFHLPAIHQVSLIIAIIVITFEFLTGLCLLLNVKTTWVARFALLFMVVFLPLTLYIALMNPVTDCGCFGDAIVISNWATFLKNIVLTILCIFIFVQRRKFKPIFNVLEQSFIFGFVILFMLIFQIHALRHLPMVDFRPYAIGNKLSEILKLDEPNGDDVLTLVKYTNINTGESKNFTIDSCPWQDSLNWQYVETITTNGVANQTPTTFIAIHPERGDIGSEIIWNKGYTFLAVASHINKCNTKIQSKLNDIAEYASRHNYTFYGISSSTQDDVDAFKAKNNVNYDILMMDETLLKTIIRSNPGLVLIKDGSIIGKWSGRDLPKVKKLEGQSPETFAMRQIQQSLNKHKYFSVVAVVALLIFMYYGRKMRKKKK